MKLFPVLYAAALAMVGPAESQEINSSECSRSESVYQTLSRMYAQILPGTWRSADTYSHDIDAFAAYKNPTTGRIIKSDPCKNCCTIARTNTRELIFKHSVVGFMEGTWNLQRTDEAKLNQRFAQWPPASDTRFGNLAAAMSCVNNAPPLTNQHVFIARCLNVDQGNGICFFYLTIDTTGGGETVRYNARLVGSDTLVIGIEGRDVALKKR